MSDSTMVRRVGRSERLIVHALVLAGGVVILRDATSLSAQSAYFPIFVGWALILLSLISMAAALRTGPLPTDEAPFVTGALGLMLLGGFVFSSQTIGFLTSTLWFLPALALVGGERRVIRLGIMTLAFTALAYLVFTLLFAQPLPAELILGEI
ncbi:MAG: tripartite tricarboxylate transporter TctB family protein [Qingshengfaniella sp.]